MSNPIYTIEALLREARHEDETFLARITGTSSRQIRGYFDEPINTPEFASLLASAQIVFRSLSVESANLFAKRILNQYAAVRALVPDQIVETGIANGVSSSYLLLALKKNGRGHLYSIGLNDPNFLPPGKEPGWLAPAWLRDRWTVHLGDSSQLLLDILTSLKSIDVFIHDSLHTYEHMMWEFDTAYTFLRKDGLLFADDAIRNSAFKDFSSKVAASDFRILRGVGFLRKPSR